MTIRLNIVVEGLTEETFVREVLYPYLSHQNIFASAKSIDGTNNYNKIKRDIVRWCKEDKNAFVTTLLDVYGLPKDFPGLAEAKTKTDIYDKVSHLEKNLEQDINCANFIPYLQLHEFESLLFSDVNAFKSVLESLHILKELDNIKKLFATPEHINNDPKTAPSKRILQLFKSYVKPLHGSLISLEIGIEKMRNECKHFDQWITRIQTLKKALQKESVSQ